MPPKACESAIRWGIAVIGTRSPSGTPTADPIRIATAIRM